MGIREDVRFCANIIGLIFFSVFVLVTVLQDKSLSKIKTEKIEHKTKSNMWGKTKSISTQLAEKVEANKLAIAKIAEDRKNGLEGVAKVYFAEVTKGLWELVGDKFFVGNESTFDVEVLSRKNSVIQAKWDALVAASEYKQIAREEIVEVAGILAKIFEEAGFTVSVANSVEITLNFDIPEKTVLAEPEK